jgi:hypothetical protein
VLLQAVSENRHGAAEAPGRMQRHRVDVGISRTAGLNIDGSVQSVERLAGPFHPHQREAERIMQPHIRRRLAIAARKALTVASLAADKSGLGGDGGAGRGCIVPVVGQEMNCQAA